MNAQTSEMSLDEIVTRLNELQSELKSRKNSNVRESFLNQIKTYDARERELFEEFEKAINQVRQDKLAASQELNAYDQELASLQYQLDNLTSAQADALKRLAAQQKLDELNTKLNSLRSSLPWDETILNYQWDDVCTMLSTYLGGKNGLLLALDMGLGKTFEGGAFIDLFTHFFYEREGRLPTILWLTKKSLVKSSCRELKKWNPNRNIIPVGGPVEQRNFMVELGIANNACIVVNYDALSTTPLLRKTSFDLVIMDEVHRLKGGANHTPTQIFTLTKEICSKAKFIIPMSGSPIQNHPKEMWCYLNIFDPEKFPNARRFERDYFFGYGQVDGDGNPLLQISWDRLIEGALRGRVIRRNKKDVLHDLPDKTREYRFVEMYGEQAFIYESLKDDFFIWLDSSKEKALSATSILAQLIRLRQAAVLPYFTYKDDDSGVSKRFECNVSAKLDEAMELIEELRHAGEQVVVFSSQFNEPLYELGRRIASQNLGKYEFIKGGTENDPIEQRFQSGETQILLINSKSGGEGLNLQKSNDWPGGASHAIFLDQWWNPKFNEQAEDRLFRKGATEPVTIHIIQAESSVDAFIQEKLDEKEAMIEGIMERDEIRSGSDWKDYLLGVL